MGLIILQSAMRGAYFSSDMSCVALFILPKAPSSSGPLLGTKQLGGQITKQQVYLKFELNLIKFPQVISATSMVWTRGAALNLNLKTVK